MENQPAKSPNPKERPVFLRRVLKVMFILFIIGELFHVFAFFISKSLVTKYYSMEFYLLYWVFSDCIYLLSLYGIYKWKKIGFYGLIGLSLLGIIVSANVFGIAGMISAIISNGILLGIYYYAIKPVWHHFE